jgi:hypothetical protein
LRVLLRFVASERIITRKTGIRHFGNGVWKEMSGIAVLLTGFRCQHLFSGGDLQPFKSGYFTIFI